MNNSEQENFEEKLIPMIEKGVKKKIRQEISKLMFFYAIWTIAVLIALLLKQEKFLNIFRGMINHFIIVVATDKYINRSITMLQSDICMSGMFLFFILTCFMYPGTVREYWPFYALTLCRLEFIFADHVTRSKEQRKEE